MRNKINPNISFSMKWDFINISINSNEIFLSRLDQEMKNRCNRIIKIIKKSKMKCRKEKRFSVMLLSILLKFI